MKLSILGSGSNGNCYYIENNDSAVLVDAGLSCKQILDRMSCLKLAPEKIKAMFLTHEHTDHIRGVDVLARKFQIPIFATKGTCKDSFICQDESLINTIKNHEAVDIAGMRIEAFSKSHDALDPVSYSVSNGKKISIITDAGYACKNIIDNVSNSDFLCIESNHDLAMLENGRYPLFLKERILSNLGHLSNLQAGLLVLEHGPRKLKNIALCHLSQNNNTPLLALETFSSLVRERKDLNPRVSLSHRHIPTPIFKI